MSKPYWELHITMTGDRDRVKQAVTSLGWSFSAIEGDPVLGPGIKLYATKHLNGSIDEAACQKICEHAADDLRKRFNCTVVREKVGRVTYDKQYKGK